MVICIDIYHCVLFLKIQKLENLLKSHNFGVQNYFDKQITKAVNNSFDVATSYLEESASIFEIRKQISSRVPLELCTGCKNTYNENKVV